jgi:hypothetical protein
MARYVPAPAVVAPADVSTVKAGTPRVDSIEDGAASSATLEGEASAAQFGRHSGRIAKLMARARRRIARGSVSDSP